MVRCREIDGEIRKKAVESQIKTHTTSNQRFYLPTSVGGLGFRSVEVETAVHICKKFFYLKNHPELQEAYEIFKKFNAKGRRTPVGDYNVVKTKYRIPEDAEEEEAVRALRSKNLQDRKDKWAENMHYARLVLGMQEQILFPATTSMFLNSKKLIRIRDNKNNLSSKIKINQGIYQPFCINVCIDNRNCYIQPKNG